MANNKLKISLKAYNNNWRVEIKHDISNLDISKLLYLNLNNTYLLLDNFIIKRNTFCPQPNTKLFFISFALLSEGYYLGKCIDSTHISINKVIGANINYFSTKEKATIFMIKMASMFKAISLKCKYGE